ncbi:hypothetical protein BKD03_11775 [Brucella sp. 09RB8471]|nr:hypothetical protein BKD03_11775 [Brucella sp. 09RB8471]
MTMSFVRHRVAFCCPPTFFYSRAGEINPTLTIGDKGRFDIDIIRQRPGTRPGLLRTMKRS